jgi:hypothetical protein
VQKWEYRVESRARAWGKASKDVSYYKGTDWEPTWDSFAKLLDELGDDGWELISVTPLSGYLGVGELSDYAGFTSQEKWVFKRPKQ